MTFALSGCSSTKVAVAPELPPMSASVQAPCKHPPLIIGADARAVIAKYAAALKACNAARANAVLFYTDLRNGLSSQH